MELIPVDTNIWFNPGIARGDLSGRWSKLLIVRSYDPLDLTASPLTLRSQSQRLIAGQLGRGISLDQFRENDPLPLPSCGWLTMPRTWAISFS